MGGKGYMARVCKNVFPRSVEQQLIEKALREWFYTGEMDEDEEVESSCQLCDHPDIRYQFQIHNRFTGSSLWIGSECIKKFATIDVYGLTGAEREKRIDQEVEEYKKRQVLKALGKLRAVEPELNVDSLIDYYDTKDAFTPNQLSLVIWRLEANSIPHRKEFFKAKIRKDKEKKQLQQMPAFKVKQILACLTPAQRKHIPPEILRQLGQ